MSTAMLEWRRVPATISCNGYLDRWENSSMNRGLKFLALLWLLAIEGLAAEPARQPNIIFILADDLAQGDLGCYGQRLIKTPNLDRMASEGTRFTQAYCGTSVCAP